MIIVNFSIVCSMNLKRIQKFTCSNLISSSEKSLFSLQIRNEILCVDFGDYRYQIPRVMICIFFKMQKVGLSRCFWATENQNLRKLIEGTESF